MDGHVGDVGPGVVSAGMGVHERDGFAVGQDGEQFALGRDGPLGPPVAGADGEDDGFDADDRPDGEVGFPDRQPGDLDIDLPGPQRPKGSPNPT